MQRINGQYNLQVHIWTLHDPYLLLLKNLVDQWLFPLFSFSFFLGVSKEKSIAYETQKNHDKFREKVSVRKYINKDHGKGFIDVKRWLFLKIVLKTFLVMIKEI